MVEVLANFIETTIVPEPLSESSEHHASSLEALSDAAPPDLEPEWSGVQPIHGNHH